MLFQYIETLQFPNRIYVRVELFFFITLLKYSECGRSQRLDEASDVRYMLIFCSKYVNYLNQIRQQQKS